MRSTERFLTTHTGSLPRPEDLIRMMWAKADGIPVDRDALRARVRAGVAEIVGLQAAAGIDIVNDGELSKPSYATYVLDRLTGFEGTSAPPRFQDLIGFPGLAKRVSEDPGRAHRKAPGCNGAVTVRDASAAQIDIDNLTAATAAAPTAGAFMTAASPGVIALFLDNQFYPSHEAYLYAIAEAMKPEYEAIARAGFILQLDCPDLAMGRHVQFIDLDLAAFRKVARLHIEALNYALGNIPSDRLRMHLCWGNYGGPHHCDVPLADIIDIVLGARPDGLSFEAANPRHAHEWELFERVKLPDGKVLIPGVLECQSNYIEHPELIAQRLGRYADLVGRENVIGGSDCGYGTWVGQAAVDPKVVWAKLAALAEGAAIASRRYWG